MYHNYFLVREGIIVKEINMAKRSLKVVRLRSRTPLVYLKILNISLKEIKLAINFVQKQKVGAELDHWDQLISVIYFFMFIQTLLVGLY